MSDVRMALTGSSPERPSGQPFLEREGSETAALIEQQYEEDMRQRQRVFQCNKRCDDTKQTNVLYLAPFMFFSDLGERILAWRG